MGGRPARPLLIVTLALAPRLAQADGGVFWVWPEPDQHWSQIGVFTGDQQALVIYDGSTETLVLSTRMKGDSRTPHAWVLPVPALVEQGQVSVCPTGVLGELQNLTQPQALVTTGGCLGCSGASSPQAASGDFSGVHNWGTIVVDAYTIHVLSADESAQLATWLRTEGYQVPVEAEPVLSDYVAQEWYFLAIKVTPPAEGGQGREELPALVVKFPSGQPVYPMRISGTSSLAQELTEVLLFIISTHRFASQNWPAAEIATAGAPSGSHLPTWETWYAAQLLASLRVLRDASGHAGFVVEWAGPLPGYASPDLQKLVQGITMPYLTRLRTQITSADMDRDVLLARATTDRSFEVRIASREVRDGRYARAGAVGTILVVGLISTALSPSSRRRRNALVTILAILPFL